MKAITELAVIGGLGIGIYALATNAGGLKDILLGKGYAETTETTGPYTGPAPSSSTPWSKGDYVMFSTLNQTITQGPQPGQEVITGGGTTFYHTTGLLESLLTGKAPGTTTEGSTISVLPGGEITAGGQTYSWTPTGEPLPAASSANTIESNWFLNAAPFVISPLAGVANLFTEGLKI
jgi:hypothetical protein